MKKIINFLPRPHPPRRRRLRRLDSRVFGARPATPQCSSGVDAHVTDAIFYRLHVIYRGYLWNEWIKRFVLQQTEVSAGLINANRGPWQLFAPAPLLTRDKDLSQPATRVDTTCWQLLRPAINTAHFFVAEVMSNYLTTGGLKKIFSTSGGPLEARGPWHLPHLPHG